MEPPYLIKRAEKSICADPPSQTSPLGFIVKANTEL